MWRFLPGVSKVSATKKIPLLITACQQRSVILTNTKRQGHKKFSLKNAFDTASNGVEYVIACSLFTPGFKRVLMDISLKKKRAQGNFPNVAGDFVASSKAAN